MSLVRDYNEFLLVIKRVTRYVQPIGCHYFDTSLYRDDNEILLAVSLFQTVDKCALGVDVNLCMPYH